jgi:hypothetical protein
MTKTISQKLREHACSDKGGFNMGWIHCEIIGALLPFINSDEHYFALTCEERVLFALFCACALETEQ